MIEFNDLICEYYFLTPLKKSFIVFYKNSLTGTGHWILQHKSFVQTGSSLYGDVRFVFSWSRHQKGSWGWSPEQVILIHAYHTEAIKYVLATCEMSLTLDRFMVPVQRGEATSEEPEATSGWEKQKRCKALFKHVFKHDKGSFNDKKSEWPWP